MWALAIAAICSIAPADTLLDVGDHALWFEIRRGDGPVTIVLEAGGGSGAGSWGPVPDMLFDRTRATVVTYDRAGLGGSDLGPLDLTPTEEMENLHRALKQLDAPGGLLFVAHSYGSMLALRYADLYGEEVVGLVLVDPMNPGFVMATGDFVFTTVPDITKPTTPREHVIVRMKRTFLSLVESVARSEAEIGAPVTVITAGDPWLPDGIHEAWRASHKALIEGRPHRDLVVAQGSDHDVPDRRPDTIVKAVEDVLTALSTR